MNARQRQRYDALVVKITGLLAGELSLDDLNFIHQEVDEMFWYDCIDKAIEEVDPEGLPNECADLPRDIRHFMLK